MAETAPGNGKAHDALIRGTAREVSEEWPSEALEKRKQLTEPQRHKLQSLIKSEQRRREEAATGQMPLFAAPKNHIIDSYQAEIDARLKSTIEAVEATDEDDTQVLFSSPRVTDPPVGTPEQNALEEARIHAIETYLHGKRRPIADTPPADQAGSSRAQLQALLQHARRSQRPSGPPAADENARIAEARRHDKTLLINWARNAGVLLSDIPARYQPNSPKDVGEALRSPSHILASLFPDAARESTAAFHAGSNDRSNRKQRGEPRPSVGGRPGDFALLLDWAKAHRRISAPQGFQLSADPALLRDGGGRIVPSVLLFMCRTRTAVTGFVLQRDADT